MSSSTGTSSAEKKSFGNADETRTFSKGTLDVVNVGSTQVGMAHFQPGWKWSECVKPIAQTDTCQSEHLGYFISGRMHVVAGDGTEMDYGPGDVMYLAPGHDAWIVGNDECVVLDFLGAKSYAKR
jgi:mannose-6-phosphate isomerase-like protein (cupin superfamily)